MILNHLTMINFLTALFQLVSISSECFSNSTLIKKSDNNSIEICHTRVIMSSPTTTQPQGIRIKQRKKEFIGNLPFHFNIYLRKEAIKGVGKRLGKYWKIEQRNYLVYTIYSSMNFYASSVFMSFSKRGVLWYFLFARHPTQNSKPEGRCGKINSELKCK